MTTNYVSCYKCQGLIPKNRLYELGVHDEEFICGTCIKKDIGKDMHNFFEGLIEKRASKD